MKAILCSNPYRDWGLRTALEARRILDQEGVKTSFCMPFSPRKGDRLEIPRHISFAPLTQELKTADILICFGGDGTILHMARDATENDVPILGVNMGSVGFMAELERSELTLLAAVAQGRYTLEERMMLEVKACRGSRVLSEDLALNDAVISKGSTARVAELEVMADQVPIYTVTGDGIIVATATGSTGYSMSAGGPIVEPTSRCILVTPVCAHQLTARSMVLPPDRLVTVRIPRGSRKQLYLSVDGGKALRLNSGDRVEVSCAQVATKLVRLSHRSFYQVISQKLGSARTPAGW